MLDVGSLTCHCQTLRCIRREKKKAHTRACQTEEEYNQQKGGAPEENRLILCCSTHVVIGIIGKLEDMRRKFVFMLRGVSILGSILVKDGISV